MSEEKTGEKKTMYVHQVDYEVILNILKRVTDVSRVFIYNMPNKASKYANDGFELITMLNSFMDDEEERWRIEALANQPVKVENSTIEIGDWRINGSKLNICIPTVNSIIIIPDEMSTNKGSKDPTKIIHLSNCIAVTPLLVKLSDEPIEGVSNKFNLGVSLEILSVVDKKEEESNLDSE